MNDQKSPKRGGEPHGSGNGPPSSAPPWKVPPRSPDSSTDKLVREVLTPPPGMLPSPLYVSTGAAESYLRLPTSPEHFHPQHIAWKIELQGLSEGPPLGLEILGDVIMGRGANPTRKPDLDLAPYSALMHGVSRQHAVLKPTQYSLYLLDFSSTNGTWYNGQPMAHGLARSLAHNDVIGLGTLRFRIKIVGRPAINQSKSRT